MVFLPCSPHFQCTHGNADGHPKKMICWADTGDVNEVVPLADKSCTLNIIQRVVEYLKKHAEFEAEQAEDEVCCLLVVLRRIL